MTTPIQNNNINSIGNKQKLTNTKKKDNTERAEAKASASALSGLNQDSVSISSGKEKVSNTVEAAQASSDIRTEKVDKIKTDIKDGTYRVDSEKIADKILRNVLSDLT